MLTIGEFSKLSHVSARMLRHYDLRGLLRPAYTGENGYRYYDETQLAEVRRIRSLQDYGFRLAEIGGLLALDDEALAARLHKKRIAAWGELHEKQKQVRQMEEQLMNMEDVSMMKTNYDVILMEQPAQTVFGLRKSIHIGQVHDLFMELHAEVQRRGLTRTGFTQLLYHGEEFDYENMEVEAQVVVQPGAETHEEPAGTFIATTHTGPYDTSRYAYDALAAWMAQHPEYAICGPAVERYLKDENEVKSPEELETAVLFRVEKRA